MQLSNLDVKRLSIEVRNAIGDLVARFPILRRSEELARIPPLLGGLRIDPSFLAERQALAVEQIFRSEPAVAAANGRPARLVRAEESPEAVQRAAEGEAEPAAEEVGQLLRESKGRRMSPAERARFEQAFGRDFGNVTIHVDEHAHRAARQLRAQAFTVGNAIYFSRNRFDLRNPKGAALVAHELTHVVQQGHARSQSQQALARRWGGHTSGRGTASRPRSVMGRVDRWEREAYQVERQAMRWAEGRAPVWSMGFSRFPGSDLQQFGGGGATPTGSAGQLAKQARYQSAGRPLSGDVRQQAEQFVGRSLPGVRVHTDQAAHGFTRSLGTPAVAVGNDIFFAQGAYRPDQAGGFGMLMHEVAHTVQQGGIARGLQGFGIGGSITAGMTGSLNGSLGIGPGGIAGSLGIGMRGSVSGQSGASSATGGSASGLQASAGLDMNLGIGLGMPRPLDISMMGNISAALGIGAPSATVHEAKPGVFEGLGAPGAEAVATGGKVLVREGALSSATDQGFPVLTHEFAHIAQQTQQLLDGLGNQEAAAGAVEAAAREMLTGGAGKSEKARRKPNQEEETPIRRFIHRLNLPDETSEEEFLRLVTDEVMTFFQDEIEFEWDRGSLAV